MSACWIVSFFQTCLLFCVSRSEQAWNLNATCNLAATCSVFKDLQFKSCPLRETSLIFDGMNLNFSQLHLHIWPPTGPNWLVFCDMESWWLTNISARNGVKIRNVLLELASQANSLWENQHGGCKKVSFWLSSTKFLSAGWKYIIKEEQLLCSDQILPSGWRVVGHNLCGLCLVWGCMPAQVHRVRRVIVYAQFSCVV
jgi:hypothetical protein